MSFFDELKRRNVFRVGVAYVIVAWLLAQVADLMLDNFGAPGWVIKSVLTLLIIGFPLAIFYAWAFELTPEGIKPQREVEREQSITAQTGRKLDRTIIVVLVLALGYFAWDKFMGSGSMTVEPTGQGTDPTAAAIEPGPQEKSIAVLPFVNMSSDPEQEFFSDGISEEILNALAKVKDLKVAGRTSSFAFKGQNQDLRLIGEALGVNHVLEGSVRKAGDKVRITAQLIQVSDGFHLWSDTYDRELTDIFAIQDEIATAILGQLKAALLDEQSIASTRTDTLAYELYLLAKQKMRERAQDSLENAAALLDQALKKDDRFAEAYAYRAITNVLLSDENYGDIPNEAAREDAKLWIDRALELNSGLADGWAALGLYWSNARLDRDKARSVQPLRRALEINPNLVDANNWLQNQLSRQGELEEVTVILERMFEIDPLYRPGISNIVFQYIINGQNEKARAVLEQVRSFFPDDVFIADTEAVVLAFEGRSGEALPLARTAWEAQPNDANTRFQYALQLWTTGQFDEILDLNGNDWRVPALSRLGRSEEATILAYRLAASGEDIGSLVNLLGRNERFEELLEFIESRWPNLDAWEADFNDRRGLGNMQMALIAQAYRAVGNEEKFTDAMTRLEESLVAQRSGGADNRILLESEAYFHMLAGDEETALAKLDECISRGWITPQRLVRTLPVFKPVAGDPRFQDIEQRMFAHLNAERAKLGLAPMEPEVAL